MTKSLAIFLPDEKATVAMADSMARALDDTAIIFLHGPLGAGKTTFCRGLLRSLGYDGAVKSPTYTLVEPYELEKTTVFHFDLYRVHDPDELEFIGIRDYFAPNAICLIEWPEHGEGWLPLPDVTCYIEMHATGRQLKLIASSLMGEKIIEKIEQQGFGR